MRGNNQHPIQSPTQSTDASKPLLQSAEALVDTHCHLTLEQLGEDPDRYWARAQRAGVVQAIVIGIDAKTSADAVSYVESREGLFAAVGIHPNEAGTASEGDFSAIRELAQHPKVVAIGESGLDTFWDRSTAEDQEYWLARHVELAIEIDLPLVLHIRGAYPRAAELLKDSAERGLRGVVHCFAGTGEEVLPFVEWGWPVSFSGILTYGKADNVRDGAINTPLEQCLVETDSPWLTPAGRRGEVNEPAFVVHVAKRLAKVKGVSLEEVARVTTANARRVFGL